MLISAYTPQGMTLFTRRKSEKRADVRPFPMSTLPAEDRSPIEPHAALRICDVFACIRRLADGAASLPLVAYRRRPDGSRERFDGRLDDLLTRPAPATTQSNLVGQLVTHLAGYGNAFVAKLRDDRGTVMQLWALHPATVQVEVVRGEPRYTVMREQGVSQHGPDDILHIRLAASLDGVTGLSPIAQCRQALGLARDLATHAESFAANHGRLGGVLHWSAGGDPFVPGADDTAATRQSFRELFGDPTKSGRVLFVLGDGEVKFTNLALTMADAEFVAQRQLSTNEIARMFGLWPWMIGSAVAGDSLTYSTVAEQSAAFAKFTLPAYTVPIEQAISADGDLSPRAVYCEFLFDALLRPDPRTRSEIYARALDPERGWMSRDEVRRLENLQ